MFTCQRTEQKDETEPRNKYRQLSQKCHTLTIYSQKHGYALITLVRGTNQNTQNAITEVEYLIITDYYLICFWNIMTIVYGLVMQNDTNINFTITERNLAI